MKFKSISIALTCVLGLAATHALFADDDGEAKKPKHTIKEVMKVGHKEGLLKKVLGGEASDDDKKQLLDLYISLVESTPEKGEMDSWIHLSGGAAIAAAKVVTGRDGAIAELETATNCKACHSVHKGE